MVCLWLCPFLATGGRPLTFPEFTLRHLKLFGKLEWTPLPPGVEAGTPPHWYSSGSQEVWEGGSRCQHGCVFPGLAATGRRRELLPCHTVSPLSQGGSSGDQGWTWFLLALTPSEEPVRSPGSPVLVLELVFHVSQSSGFAKIVKAHNQTMYGNGCCSEPSASSWVQRRCLLFSQVVKVGLVEDSPATGELGPFASLE